MSVDLKPEEIQIIKNILKKYDYKFYIFGSRAKNTAKKFSDLDLVCKGNVSTVELSDLREKFEESALPFKVDLISWSSCSDKFKKLIEPDLLEFCLK